MYLNRVCQKKTIRFARIIRLDALPSQMGRVGFQMVVSSTPAGSDPAQTHDGTFFLVGGKSQNGA